jgi:hypothetical protein
MSLTADKTGNNRLVIVVNGRPRPGKDTAVSFLDTAFKAFGYETMAVSSIDCIRRMLRAEGVNVEAKGAKERDLLAAVGSAMETYNNYRTEAVVRAVSGFMGRHDFEHMPRAAFVHIREQSLIDRLFDKFRALGITQTTLKVTRASAALVTSNASDAEAEFCDFDHEIENNAGMARLAANCAAFVESLQVRSIDSGVGPRKLFTQHQPRD